MGLIIAFFMAAFVVQWAIFMLKQIKMIVVLKKIPNFVPKI